MDSKNHNSQVVNHPKHLPHRSQLAQAILVILGQAKEPMKSPELDFEVISYLKLSDEQLKIMRSQNRTQISYDLAWTRTSLKAQGLIHQPLRRHWSLSHGTLGNPIDSTEST